MLLSGPETWPTASNCRSCSGQLFDEESEDNDSDEEGDIYEDMMDNDWYEICIFSVCCAKLFASQNKVLLNLTIYFFATRGRCGCRIQRKCCMVHFLWFVIWCVNLFMFILQRYIIYGQNSQSQDFQQNNLLKLCIGSLVKSENCNRTASPPDLAHCAPHSGQKRGSRGH